MIDLTELRERGNARAFTVSELNNYVKTVFDSDRILSSVTVKGEISNFVNHRSGHLYFSIKDTESQIRAVMFRSSAARLKFMPESGMKVVVTGSVSVFTRDGSYQLYVNSMQPDGIGALYLAYEQLKEKLALEGLFSEEHKKQIPAIPRSIGVITSPTGAAVRDIINVTGRRFPLAKVYLYPSLVQGDGAEDNLVRAVDYFDKSGLVDVVIIGRGGGSIEDLWAFNSERLARSIFEADVPVISAVGHETDFTICDFVSDLRAPTPSAAAELAVPDVRELLLRIDSCFDRATHALKRNFERARERFERLRDTVYEYSAEELLKGKREELIQLYEKALLAVKAKIEAKRSALTLNAEKTNAMSPLRVLSRGYSITGKGDTVLYSTDGVSVGDEIVVRLHSGSIKGRVTEVYEEK